MITGITIDGPASYQSTPSNIVDLKPLSFFFGENGCGKTTISRVLANPSGYGTCRVNWKNNSTMGCLVYNRDFVDANLSQSPHLTGVFTIGEAQIEIEKEIAEKRAERGSLNERREKDLANLEEFRATWGSKNTYFKNEVWKLRESAIPESLIPAFDGFRNSKDKFAAELLRHRQSDLNCPVIETLQERALVAFAQNPPLRIQLQTIDTARIRELEDSECWNTPLIGKTDVPIAALIERLECTGWVRTGRGLLSESDGLCPFCQQTEPASLRADLELFFDETYEHELHQLTDSCEEYERSADQAITTLSTLIGRDDFGGAMRPQMVNLQEALRQNKALMRSKLSQSHLAIGIQRTAHLLSQVNAQIEQENTQVLAHNERVRNLANEKQSLSTDVWTYFANGLAVSLIDNIQQEEANLHSAIQNLDGRIKKTEKGIAEIDAAVAQLERQTSSVRPTVEAINKLISAFGFSSFSLGMTGDEKHYLIQRADGAPAAQTLSEGERTLVAFLYFYHRAQGADQPSGTTKDQVLVIDDPVSSLDSTVLFMVGALVRRMCGWTIAPEHGVRQVIVLTHNAYFFKEIASQRNDGLVRSPHHWIVRKVASCTQIESYGATCPISSSYDHLWDLVRRASKDEGAVDSTSLANALRRILEYYFGFTGSKWESVARNDMTKEESVVMKSLISWLHDGSHSIGDDLHMAGSGSVSAYLSLFERIFEHNGQTAHYRMMMRLEDS